MLKLVARILKFFAALLIFKIPTNYFDGPTENYFLIYIQ